MTFCSDAMKQGRSLCRLLVTEAKRWFVLLTFFAKKVPPHDPPPAEGDVLYQPVTLTKRSPCRTPITLSMILQVGILKLSDIIRDQSLGIVNQILR